jgi:predicted signal transduction protein with EAL and GGDEF domain
VVGGHGFYINSSIGISVYPNDGADAAMYKAKNIDRGGFQFYTEELSERALQHYTIESGLRQALNKQQISVLYQPKIDLSTGVVKGAEALVRWRHPKLGDVPPY